jgi:signal transduction histidine kinase
MGLQTMEYRANLIGGSLDIVNKTNGGTLVNCLVLQEVVENG